MNIKFISCLFCIQIAYALTAQSTIVKPYLQNAFPDEMTIMWEVDNAGIGSIHYGDTPFDLSTEIVSTTEVSNGTSLIHTATLNGLSPSTKYYYKTVMEDGSESLVYHFITPPLSSAEQSVQLVAMSDMQRDGSHPNKFMEIVDNGILPIVNMLISDDISELDAVIVPGDLVPTGGNYNHWKDYFFAQGDTLFSLVPLYPVLGNHEYFGGGSGSNFIKYFSLPSNGPVELADRTWYKDISNIRIIGLDSNANGTDQDSQLTWLQNLLDDTCNEDAIDFVFAELHHPHKSELWTPGESSFTGEVIEIMETFTNDCNKASIHFFGHTHGYSRGQSQDAQHLWVNVATAGGAIDNWGEFPNADYAEFSKSQDEYGFVYLDVQAGEDPSFTLQRYGRGDQDAIEDNILRDEITIRNQEFGPNTPENIFPKGDTLAINCITLQASQYYDLEDLHQATQWQIAHGNDFEDSIVWQSWKQSENWYNEVNTQANDNLTDEEVMGLDVNKKYHWRVRYRDEYLKWSQWSTSSQFFTIAGGDTLSSNLILNGDAEDGITSWTGDIESLTNAECNSVTPYAGVANFGVGGICANESNVGTAYQEIDLTAYGTDIDNENLAISYSLYMRNFNGSDLPESYIEYYDASDNLLLSSNIISNSTGSWTKKTNYIIIPATTRYCRLLLKGTRLAGSDNDSYFDNIELYVVERSICPECIGESNIDMDGDGYCDDIDCNDDNALIYPGALEICDLLDNNCDNLVDVGDTVRWVGNGSLPIWSDGKNWDQEIIPLPCQYVIIDDPITVTVSSAHACKGLLVGDQSTTIISEGATLLINGNDTGTDPAMIIEGTLTNNGKCIVKNIAAIAVEVHGTFINENKLEISLPPNESILVRSGATFDNQGSTIIK